MTRILALALLLLPALPARADDALRDKMQTAVTKGTKWLAAQQAADGSWSYANAPMKLTVYPMPEGVTAFCAFALLKCGVAPTEPVIQKAFAFIRAQKPRYTYAVGCTLLAIEALADYDPDRQPVRAPGEDEGTRVRDGKGRKVRLDPADRKLAQQCVDFLVAHQRQTGLWSYHAAGQLEDNSNTQYAMLGLDAAERLGIKVPPKVYEKAARRLIDMQDPGQKVAVPAFPVPGADASFRELRKLEAQLIKDLSRAEKKLAKDETALEEERRTIERKATERFLSSMGKGEMEARGWAYMHRDLLKGQHEWKKNVTGAMTASAMAALFICKAHLEGTGGYRALEADLVKSLRDGAAWLAHNFDISKNPPGQPVHHYYWLYGLERAGILGLVERFGSHDWFAEGVGLLVGAQGGEGSWQIVASTSGPVPDTCFALLFLARGTTPVVRVPRRVATGSAR
ncbi:MAG: hypothetical protein AB7N76_06000 [Planctomycetota bacterium]